MSERQIKIDNETVAKFFEGMKDAFLFDEVKRYNIKGMAYLNTPSKFYCQDIGLRNVRINFREPNEGFLIENAIYNELKTREYLVDVGFVETKIKNKLDKWVYAQLEVDFIARRGSKEYPPYRRSAEGGSCTSFHARHILAHRAIAHGRILRRFLDGRRASETIWIFIRN